MTHHCVLLTAALLTACVHLSVAGIFAQRLRCTFQTFVYEHEHIRVQRCEFAPQSWWQMSHHCKDLPENRPSPIRMELSLCQSESVQLKPIELGGGWSENRKFVFHFHWGSRANMEKGIGSEHRLVDAAGKEVPTPLEVHIVCKRRELSVKQAVSTPDAIAVLGGFIQPMKPADNETLADYAISELLANITGLLIPMKRGPHSGRQLRDEDAPTVQLQLRDLLPDNLQRFVNYDGAFTTPGCNPVAQWHLFTDMMKIRKELLLQFTTVFFDRAKTHPMVNNFRPVMSRHGREIRCSFGSS
uniref:carbonic anhydrase n=1 Tax=Macrostomum lignano TaxID=282301 RepID=A0A1I8GEY2_9PLAT